MKIVVLFVLFFSSVLIAICFVLFLGFSFVQSYHACNYVPKSHVH